jgi:hypothetical protein
MKHRKPPEVCPVCGEDVPPKSVACPDCGADYESGWKDDDTNYGALDLPDWAYEDDEEKVVRPKFHRPSRTGMNPLWRWVALGLLTLWAWWLVKYKLPRW